MAKGKKSAKATPAAADPGHSLLHGAWLAFGRGDVVTARELALAVLSGKTGKDDVATAQRLSKELSVEGAVVGELPEDVARAMLTRILPPPKTYVFALLCAAIFGLLLTLAMTRY